MYPGQPHSLWLCELTPFLLFLSISKLAEVLREAIEDEAKIVHELTLPGTQFVINEVRDS